MGRKMPPGAPDAYEKSVNANLAAKSSAIAKKDIVESKGNETR